MAPTAPATNSTETVTIACKLPHGLVLRVFDMVEFDEPVLGGGFRKSKISQERPERFVINGFSHPQNRAAAHPIIEGFALTPGVPKELWEKWLDQNRRSDMVKNGLIFAQPRSESAEAMAKERKATRSGLERLDPNALPGVRIDAEAMAARRPA
jgi:hypothetical protein